MITELEPVKNGGTKHEDFGMRDEQISAVNKTYDYYNSIWGQDKNTYKIFVECKDAFWQNI